MIKTLLRKLHAISRPVVPFDFQQTPFIWLDLSVNNQAIFSYPINETALLDEYIQAMFTANQVSVAVGGYNEEREFYKLSPNFHTTDVPRSIHLGIDIWAAALTPVFAVLDGKVHSFANNNYFGDYGATIILQHDFEGLTFYTLYGHLSLASLANLYEGKTVKAGEQIATFGVPKENGNWSPHLHFQIIADMEGKKGDYYGVASKSARGHYLANCPNPNLLLQIPSPDLLTLLQHD
ncbi:MAG: peptidoglycan DD-metalloendopeptidase family protein [Thermoflexibacteraceae bacterium]